MFHLHDRARQVQYFGRLSGSRPHNIRLGQASGVTTQIATSQLRAELLQYCSCAAATVAGVTRVLIAVAALMLLRGPVSVRCQEIWFGPLSPDYGVTAVKDWSTLFHPNPEWNQLAGQIHVYQTADGFYRITPEDQLQAVTANATSHHIALAMEIGSITQRPDEACDRTEGYLAPSVVPAVIRKLTHSGARLQFIRLDGPVWFGHYQACKLTLAEIVRRVAETLRPLFLAFPDLVVGDVEPPQSLAQSPDWEATFLNFARQFEAATGHQLAFLQMDVNWRQPDWPGAITAMQRVAHGAGMKFGVIYNSDDEAATDQIWIAEAKRHFDELETRYGLIPDQAVFGTWNRHPTRVFPETSDDSHSFLVAQYLLPRTHLAVQRSAAGVLGRLTALGGHAVPGARIVIDALGVDPRSPPPLRSVAGTVPPQARFAVLGLRVNTECWCAGENDLLLGTFSYRETAEGSAHYEYRYAAPPRIKAGVVAMPASEVNLPLVRLKVAADRNLGFNSPAFPVTPNAKFQLQVPLGSLNGEGMFGTAVVIWLDAQQKGFRRDNIRVGNDAAPIAAAVTDASGSFAAALPENAHWRQRPLLAHYAGAPTLRAAYAVAR
jgi:hypothetical protein